jgi:ribonuclease VapC
MIVIDSSALIAILEREPDAATYAAAIHGADRLFMSAVDVHETGIVMREGRGEAAVQRLWRFLQTENDCEIVAFDEPQARGAMAAFNLYGMGIAPKARRNLADCAALCPCEVEERAAAFHGWRLRRDRYMGLSQPGRMILIFGPVTKTETARNRGGRGRPSVRGRSGAPRAGGSRYARTCGS